MSSGLQNYQQNGYPLRPAPANPQHSLSAAQSHVSHMYAPAAGRPGLSLNSIQQLDQHQQQPEPKHTQQSPRQKMQQQYEAQYQEQQQAANERHQHGNASDSKHPNQDEFVADPLPFDYNDFNSASEIAGRDIINMASVIGDEHNRGIRRLPEPKSIRENFPAQNNLPYAITTSQQHGQAQQSMQHQMLQPQHAQSMQSPHHHMAQQYAAQSMMYQGSSPMHAMQSASASFQAMLAHGSRKEEGHPPSPMNAPPMNASPMAGHHGAHYPHPPQHFQPQYSMPYMGGHAQAHGPPASQHEVSIKLKTPLKNKYWRNGRRNLQCFPSCKVFGDYSYIKIDDLKQHDFMWGKCRGSLVTEVSLNGSFGFEDLIILGRVHSLDNIPVPFEEAVMTECMIGRVVPADIMDIMKEQWITGERLPDFIHMSSRSACFEFKPKVWKYSDDMAQGKSKRRNVRYYCQFEAFIPIYQGDVRSFIGVGSGMSSAFEVGSSRVLARQKRKAAGRLSEGLTKKKAKEDGDEEGLEEESTQVKAPIVHEEPSAPAPEAISTPKDAPIVPLSDKNVKIVDERAL